MRNTSGRRRAGGGRMTKVYGVRPLPPTAAGRDLTVPEGTPGSTICHQCGARLMVLANGRPKGHAPGGVTTSFNHNRFACEGSGNTGA